tara:strand:+ start:139 stop:456 length:318 start_codon:yes stop_codon:yes gene_type:complete
LRINIFNLFILILLLINFNGYAEIGEIDLSDTKELRCLYKINSDRDVINSKLNCTTSIDKKSFNQGWDKKSCRSYNYKFKKDNLIIDKVAIYCLNFNEEKYIQVF